ncbi:MAG: hypothetical protein ACLGI3_09175 [Actinomycetes bacterium]
MRPPAAPHRSGPEGSRPIGVPVLAAIAVVAIYAVVVLAAGGSLDHTVARAGRDWPLLLVAVAGALVPGMLAPRAPRRWRSLLATALGGLAAGVALTAALGGGGHTVAELEDAVGTPLPTAALAAPYAALVAIALLVSACISVHGTTMTRRRSHPPVSPA